MTLADVPQVQVAERAAGQLFRDCAEPAIARCADAPVFTGEELAPYVEHGRAWVATDEGTVVGFVLVHVVDGCAHVDEVAVAPTAGRRGLGTALMDAAQRWAARNELPGVTLTTFRDVPWNGPWYTKLGFRELPESEWTPGLRALRQEEADGGLPEALRIVMGRGHDEAGARPGRSPAS